MTYLNILASVGWLFAAIAQWEFSMVATAHTMEEKILVLWCLACAAGCMFIKDRKFRI